MRNACLLLVTLICSAVVFSAQTTEFPWDSGNAFVRVCAVIDKPTNSQTEKDSLQFGVCHGYLRGLADGIQMMQRLDPSPSFCLNADVENEQEIRILLKYVRDNPADAHLPTSSLFYLAMKEIFPCPVRK